MSYTIQGSSTRIIQLKKKMITRKTCEIIRLFREYPILNDRLEGIFFSIKTKSNNFGFEVINLSLISDEVSVNPLFSFVCLA